MAILNQKRILNLIPKISAPVTIHVSQGDVGTEIQFTLVKGDELFVNPGNVSASVHGIREDGANFGAFTCTLIGSTLSFPLHSEMTAVKGSALAEVVIVDNNGNKVGSANFAIMVEESVFPLGVTYDNDVSVYESILAYVQTIPAQVEADFNAAITQEINTRSLQFQTLNSNLGTEASTRQSSDANLQSQINQIIAPSGEAPSSAEVQNARIGADNQTYSTLGDAIRNQMLNIQQEIDVVIARMKYSIRTYNSALGDINSRYPTVTYNIDKRALYIATTTTGNNERLMYYDEGEQTWKYLNWIYKSTIPNLVEDSERLCKEYLQNKIFQEGYLFYEAGISSINTRTDLDTSRLYVSYSSTEGTTWTIFWHDGNHWCSAPYKINELSVDKSMDDLTKELDVINARIIYGIRSFAGGTQALTTQYNDMSTVLDRRALYVNTSEDPLSNPFNKRRFMYFDYDNNVWDYLKYAKIDDYQELINESSKMASIALSDELLRKGYIVWRAGLVSFREWEDADTTKIYVSANNAYDANRIIVYDGDRWIYSPFYITDFPLIMEINSQKNGGFIEISPVINSKIATILGYNQNEKFFNVAFLTDTHSNNQDATQVLGYFRAIELTKIADAYVHGGDLISSYEMGKTEFIKEMSELTEFYKNYGNVLFAKGNHDNNHNDEVNENITNAQYRVLMLPKGNDIKYNSNAEDGCYYYKDFDFNKIRIIILDSFESYDAQQTVTFSSEQTNWLYQEALDVPNGWSVIIFTHMNAGRNTNVTRVMQAFNDRGTQYGDYIFSNDKTTHLIALIHGHQHVDNSDTSFGFNVIGVTCGFGSGGGMDIFTVDTTQKKLYETRIGAGSSREYTYT